MTSLFGLKPLTFGYGTFPYKTSVRAVIQAHPSLKVKGALQPAGVVEFAVRQPACQPNLCDNGTRFKGEVGLIPTHNGLHCPHPPGLKLMSLPCGHHFPSPPFYLLNKVLLLLISQLLGGFSLHLLSPVQVLFLYFSSSSTSLFSPTFSSSCSCISRTLGSGERVRFRIGALSRASLGRGRVQREGVWGPWGNFLTEALWGRVGGLRVWVAP